MKHSRQKECALPILRKVINHNKGWQERQERHNQARKNLPVGADRFVFWLKWLAQNE